MGTKHGKLKIMLIAAITILFAGTYASAQMGMGYGGQQGWGSGSGYGYGCALAANLNADDLKKLDDARTAFFEGTKDLRQNIYQKRLELASELAKQKIDPQKAAALQKEISDLRSRLSQKHLEFVLQMKKINPSLGMGFTGSGSGHHGMMGGGMMGPGMMHGGMMDRGYGMGPGTGMMGSRGGYGNGPGRMGPRGGYGMGPGMMGPGTGRGMGPGGSGSGYRQSYRGSQSPLKEKEAVSVVENYLKSTRNPNLKPGKVKDAGTAFEVEILTKNDSLVDKVLVNKRSGWIRSAY